MKHFIISTFILLPGTFAWSFDCQKATTPTEKAICSSPKLVSLDTELNKAYSETLARINQDPSAAKNFKSMQKDWLKKRAETCKSDVQCLTSSYQAQVEKIKTFSAPATSASVNSPSSSAEVGGIAYKPVIKKAETPDELNLEYPVFSGSNKAAVDRLNKWVKSVWGTDNQCDPHDKSEVGEFTHTIVVQTLTPAIVIMKETSGGFCPGNAHPNMSQADFVVEIASGKTVDFWKKLTPASRKKLLKQISEQGKKDSSDDPGCSGIYDMAEIEDSTINIAFEKEKAIITPSFPHAVQGCERPWSLPIAEFSKFYAGQNDVLEILKGIK